MALNRLKSPEAAARWLTEWCTGQLRTDSRTVQAGDAFVAWPGHAQDGRQFVSAALAAGAATCLVDDAGIAAFGLNDARIATLPGLKAATGAIAAAYLGHPSQQLKVIATTGTNGKTSTAWWTAQALTALGQRCGVVGTLGIGEPPGALLPGQPERAQAIEFTGLTTPDPVRLQQGLRHMVDAGFAACAMEASSIGICENRMAGTQVRVALFTNFTRDHLDYHGSMADYWLAKRRLFDWPGLEAAVINLDDTQGAALAEELGSAGRLDVWTYSLEAPARLRASGLRYDAQGLVFDLTEHGDESRPLTVRTRLIGSYNASNVLAVLGGLRAVGVPLADAVAVCPGLTSVPGRMQRVPSPDNNNPDVVVDYAHTPDALEKALQALQPLARARGGRLWCVFGCGGDRDATKRPLMGAIAAAHADQVVITSDNPRTESPAAILAQIASGSPRREGVVTIENRHEAIAHAVAQAAPADVILLAGKGHEDYQDIGGRKLPFSDAQEAQEALARRAGGNR